LPVGLRARPDPDCRTLHSLSNLCSKLCGDTFKNNGKDP